MHLLHSRLLHHVLERLLLHASDAADAAEADPTDPADATDATDAADAAHAADVAHADGRLLLALGVLELKRKKSQSDWSYEERKSSFK